MTTCKETVRTQYRSQMIDVTARVAEVVRQSAAKSGIVHVFSLHTTAGMTVNENADPDVQHDLLKKLDELIPRHEPYYRHAEGNSDSHLKTSMMGNSVTIPLQNGKLALGQWQGVYFCEFDGPRERQMLIMVAADPE